MGVDLSSGPATVNARRHLYVSRWLVLRNVWARDGAINGGRTMPSIIWPWKIAWASPELPSPNSLISSGFCRAARFGWTLAGHLLFGADESIRWAWACTASVLISWKVVSWLKWSQIWAWLNRYIDEVCNRRIESTVSVAPWKSKASCGWKLLVTVGAVSTILTTSALVPTKFCFALIEASLFP